MTATPNPDWRAKDEKGQARDAAAEQDVLQPYDKHVNAYVRKPVGYVALLGVVRSIESFWIGSALPPPRELAGAGVTAA